MWYAVHVWWWSCFLQPTPAQLSAGVVENTAQWALQLQHQPWAAVGACGVRVGRCVCRRSVLRFRNFVLT
jgi:hypothetical protein